MRPACTFGTTPLTISATTRASTASAWGARRGAGRTRSSSAGRWSSTRSAVLVRIASMSFQRPTSRSVSPTRRRSCRWPCRSAVRPRRIPSMVSRCRVRKRASVTVLPTSRESGATMASAMPISCDRSEKYPSVSGRASSANRCWSSPTSTREARMSTSRTSPASSSIFAEGASISLPFPRLRSTARTFAPHEPRRSRVSRSRPTSGEAGLTRSRYSRPARSYLSIQSRRLGRGRAEAVSPLFVGSQRRAKSM